MSITVSQDDKEWLEQGVIKELKLYGLTEEKAKAAFEQSQLLSLLDEMPEYIFHFDPKYWAKELVRRKMLTIEDKQSGIVGDISD